jgi:hypothetical protein
VVDISTWFFITSGLFLGWSLGANHAVNVFGTAVVSKMVKFRTAAIIAGIFVILGSVISGSGTTKTIGELGPISSDWRDYRLEYFHGFTDRHGFVKQDPFQLGGIANSRGSFRLLYFFYYQEYCFEMEDSSPKIG